MQEIKKLQKKHPGVPDKELKVFDKFNVFFQDKKVYTLDNRKNITELSNFIMEPVAQIRNEELNESTYIYWIENALNERELISLKAEHLCRNNSFSSLLFHYGYFVWKGTDKNLTSLFERLNENILRCTEVTRLFWQKNEEVWVWSNGISTLKNEFIPANETGIVKHQNKAFFIKAHSNLIREDSSKLRNERHLQFKQEKVLSSFEWSELMCQAYGEKSYAGIAFAMMSSFSDILFEENRSLPILNLIGKPGSGKNEFAGSILNLQYNTADVKPLSLANKTTSALSDRLMLVQNGMAFLDEFKNVREDELLLKDIYNRTPRSRTDMPGLQIPEITSTVLVAGEHYPEEEALVTRCIPLKFQKSTYSAEQTEAYNKIKKLEKQSFSHLQQEIIVYRKAVENNFKSVLNQEENGLKALLKGKVVHGRIINNYAVQLAVFKIMETNGFSLAFSYGELKSYYIDLIDEQLEALSNTGIVNNFWKAIEYMRANFDTIAIENLTSEQVAELKLCVTKYTDEHDKKEAVTQGRTKFFIKRFCNSKRVVFLTWRSLYANFVNAAKKLGFEIVSETNLRDYLRSSDEYIGKVINRGSKNLDADVFDLDKLNIQLYN